MAPPSLLGPPELRIPTPRTSSEVTPKVAAPADPFMDLMVSKFNATVVEREASMGFTENFSPTFLSSGNPCLDFFFHVVPSTPPESLTERLKLAWSHDPLTTLKLVCNLRGVRGTGKSDKEGFYAAALWVHANHPKTLACNVASFAEFGYFKDLPEILYRLLEGLGVRKLQKMEWAQRKGRSHGVGRRRRVFGIPSGGSTKTKRKSGKGAGSSLSKEERILRATERIKTEEEKVKAAREEKRLAMAKKAVERYNRDSDYRFLHDRVSDLFADHLKSDMDHLKSGKLNKISLAAKWCPSIDSSFDRSTLLCESVAKRFFSLDSYPEYEGVEEAHYAYRVRDRLRKEVLVPLRKALELPEIYMGAMDWGSIPYNRVASVAMKNYKEKFMKHDGERFEAYLESVRSGKAKIAAGALLPHEIIGSLHDGDGGAVAELQWRRMVEDLAKKGKLTNCLAVCDVSGSMSGIPMEVSVALGVLVSELCEEPWKGKLITFSERPQLHTIEGDDLESKTEFVRRMEWGTNTNFQMVFDLILQVAVTGNLPEEKMVKRVFVFSDMEFDQASANDWETDYRAIVRKFTEKGYGKAIPEIVFWNLRDSRATPVPGDQKGVALVSGFSKNLITLFLEEGGILSPVAVMDAAIAGEAYRKLAVFD